MRHSTLLFFAVLSLSSLSQTPNSPGTEHWVAFMENLDLQFNNDPTFHLVISSEQDAAGSITVPATGYSIPFSISAGQDTVMDLPQNIYYAEGDEALYDFGLRVTSDAPVSVYAYHDRQYFSEASLVLPTTCLGSEYTVVAHKDDSDISPCEFVVLATVDNTVVELTPSVLTASFRPPGVPFSVELDAGKSLQIQAYQDLSGTRVRSTDPEKPIAVFAGARQAQVNCIDGGADDHLYNQVYPLQLWARDHFVVPYLGRGGDHVHVVAGLGGANVNAGGLLFTLAPGGTAALDVVVPTRILSDGDIAVGQFNDSQACNGASGDPCFLFVPPTTFTDTRCIWNSRTGDGTPEHHVNIVMNAGGGPDPIFLDGTDISAQFDPVPNVGGYWYAQIPVTSGHHELISEKPFQAVAYGFGEYNSYSFALGFENATTTGMSPITPPRTPSAQALVSGEAWWPNWSSTTNEDIRIFDPSGRLVARATLHPGGSIDPGLGKGMYLYERWSVTERIGAGRLIVR